MLDCSHSIDAEEKGDLSLLTKANPFRKTVSEKKEFVLTLSETLTKLEEESMK